MDLHLHWEEGLFLQPHHLQRSQKLFSEAVVRERRLNYAYPYGLQHAREKQDDLEKMVLRFERLLAVMPSGLEVSFPDAADLPPLDFRAAFAAGTGALTVYLAVPLWLDGRPNSARISPDGPREKVVYTVYEKDCADENTGINPKAVSFRRVNARLTLEADDPDLETIPLLRLSRVPGFETGGPRLEYHGPSLVLNGVLRETAIDLATQVEVSRSDLIHRIRQTGRQLDIMRRAELEQMLRLRTLNRFAGRLPALARAPNTTPFAIYLELRALLGELSGLQPEQDLFEVPAYNHDDPYPCFRELSKNIRILLGTATGPRFLQVDFVKLNDRYRADFEDRHFIQPNDYFIGIEGAENAAALAALVKDQDTFKLVPRSMEDTPIRGMQIEDVRAGGLPLVLPARQGLHYFHILVVRSDNRAWEDIRRERAASIRWPEARNVSWKISMYMTLPAEVREAR